MPIRINLKELFDSDSQEITIDKVNFNFNKLLELGIGLPGPTGITGSIGSAGPLGPQGLQGEDGNKWFVGSGNPTGQTFTGLNDDDFYIDVDNSSIFQYDSSTSTWDLLIDLETVVNNYLAASGSTFVRGLGDASPLDNRFILFPQRGNTANDSSTDEIDSIATNNDIFYLNNFNESVYNISNWPPENELYNSIQKIHVDYTSGIFGRYHLELGTLYNDINGDFQLTELKHNLKFRHYVNDLQGGAIWAVNSSEPINVAHLSMAPTEAQGPTFIDYNSVFEFINAKYNDNGVVTTQERFTTRLGARESLREYNNDNTHIDGISFETQNSSTVGTFGIILDLGADPAAAPYNAPFRYINRDYVAIKHSGGGSGRTTSILLDNETIQNNGNIEQISSSLPEPKKWQLNIGDPELENSNSFGNTPIIVVDNQIFAVNSTFNRANVSGLLTVPQEGCTVSRYGIGGDKDNPYNLERYCIGSTSTQVGNTTTYDSSTEVNPTFDNTTKKLFHGTGLADMKSDGKYIYSVHNNMRGSSKVNICDGIYHARTYFQISKINNQGLQGIGHINDYLSSPPPTSYDQTVGSENAWLSGAWRLELDGNIAWVVTNNLKDWGHNSFDFSPTSTAYSQYPNDMVNNYSLPGNVMAVDITDPQEPKIASGFGLAAALQGATQVNSHHLDMCQDSRHLYTLTLELGTKTGGGGFPTPGFAGDGSCCVSVTYQGQSQAGSGCETSPGGTPGNTISFAGYNVKINAYSKQCISGESIPGNLSLQAKSDALFDNTASPTSITQSNCRNAGTINHFGAIDTDGTYVYAVFNNTIKISEIASPTQIGPGEAYLSGQGTLNDITALWQYTDFSNNVLATDCKLVGNSLYILHTSEISGSQDQYSVAAARQMYVSKVDIKDPAQPQRVWSSLIENDNGDALSHTSRFVIVGNTIYLHQGNQANLNDALGGLITLEVDGLETDHINAGIISADSLKTSELNVDRNVEIHGSVNIGGRMNVSCAASFNQVDISGGLSVNGLPAGSGTPVGSIMAYMGTDEPTGWLRMNGQTVPASNYPELKVLGDPLGWVYTTSGKFGNYEQITLPDLKNRFLMGQDPAGPGLGHLGGSYGTSFTLQTANLPAHDHEIKGTTVGGTDGKHVHNISTAVEGTNGQTHVKRTEGNNSPVSEDSGFVKDEASAHAHQIDFISSQEGQGNAVQVSTPEPPHMEVVYLIKAVPGF